jgi:mono/diheme cytochrome c family protein
MKISRVALALGVAFAAVAAATRRDFRRPNAEIFPEMAYSPAYGSQSANPALRGGGTSQPRVPGSRPRDVQPLPYGPSDADRERAGRELANPAPVSLETLARGRAVYEAFCLPCHGPGGQGDGAVARRVPAFAMNIIGKATADLPDGALFHIVTFGRNHMPAHGGQIAADDRWRAVRYLRDLQRQEADRMARLGIRFEEDPRRTFLVSADYGKELFGSHCASCHGEEGGSPKPGVPTLNLARVLAVADEDYYLDIITHGRKGTEMPAWEKVLTPTQIRSLARHIRSWYPAEPGAGTVPAPSAGAGDVARGRALFRGNCAACHGRNGEGGIGNALRAPSFLAMASDAFIRETIIRGRGHTAMPAGYEFRPEDIADLLAFVRSWSRPASRFEDVQKLRAEATARNAALGKKLFRARCASCHGDNGEGGIGPRLDGPSFLALADDRFLYRAIVEGRPGTAMPAWRFLSAEDMADLITFMRGWAPAPPALPPIRPGRGRAEFGALLYRQYCAACHGPDGAGGVGNQIANPVFLSSATDELLWRTVAYGKDRTAMRGFLKSGSAGALAPLEAADIDHLVAYLRRLQADPKSGMLKRPHPAPSLAAGREIYEGKGGCARCHGAAGEGASGPALGDPDFLHAASDGFVIGTLVLGREASEMLSFVRGGNVNLTPAEIENVAGYVRSFERRPARAGRRIDRSPAAVAEGALLFATHCAQCHGSEGRGPRNNRMNGFAPSLNNPEFLHAADNGLLLATIALGRPGTPMRAFARGTGGIAELSNDQIRRIVAFMRSWEDP